MAATIRRVVDNRIFLLGLDDLYRKAMKKHEGEELLGCARVTAEALGVSPADVPIEGYYTETPQLSEYFRLMRALQGVDSRRAPAVDHLPHFRRLKQVGESGLFGASHDSRYLLSTGADPLTRALEQDPFPKSWSIANLTKQAGVIAAQSTDFSLVALAALACDAVVLTALRESVVLYARLTFCRRLPEEPFEYIWNVDETIAARARRFVTTFNELFDERLPEPSSANAPIFWNAHSRADIVGRCVRISVNPTVLPPQHYHWAIAWENDGLVVRDFWSPEVWTTERYREEQEASEPSEKGTMEKLTEDGVPIRFVDVTNWRRRRGG
jgi:hypothetical protein